MEQFQKILKKALDWLGFLNDDEKLSLTNVAVIIFLSITVFRSLFGNAVFSYEDFKWVIQPIDFASTLPLLFALGNYGHRRTINNSSAQITDNNVKNQ